MDKKHLPIGFMDSGLGGLSVMKEAIKLMPNEDFLYYGDSANAPYGIRSTEEIKKLTFSVVDKLLNQGIKALTVACNTATGAAISDLRAKYTDLPIIGIEPAIKPAVVCNQGGRVIVIATPTTVKQDKFINLMEKYKGEVDVQVVACPGLMDFVERGGFSKQEIFNYLDNYLKPVLTEDTESIVLGCTHYPFLKKEIQEYVGKGILLIDGSKGTSSELRRRIIEAGVETDSTEPGTITILNSSPKEEFITRSFELLDQE